MRQNMFQEGLYQVFFKETRPSHPTAQDSNNGELNNARIHRWFGSVVNTRLLVIGVVQIFNALACTLTTVSHACVRYDCSVSMMTPVWSSLFYVAAGCLAVEVQRKASRLKIISLMSLNVFGLLVGFSALLANSLVSVSPAALSSNKQRAGSHVANVSSILFTTLCLLGSVYILFLSWRGLRRYSSPQIQAYCHVSQDPEDTNGLLLEQEVNCELHENSSELS
ncbi:uncharacterized protein si:dkey-30c15.13 [Nematolebias whitei]|uniref:uncharacterized protein si:dkey-30c15.13 n=1 Tax=Nematolebias whitei TaxID=451745 RepID=UPI00189ACF1F|nr:uncharacterized protein si:dkey-30c15.13 [Nematolebias whitei]